MRIFLAPHAHVFLGQHVTLRKQKSHCLGHPRGELSFLSRRPVASRYVCMCALEMIILGRLLSEHVTEIMRFSKFALSDSFFLKAVNLY